MNAEANQPRATLNMVGRWDFDQRNHTRDMLIKAGLSQPDAARLVKAERIAATLCALTTLAQRNARLRDAAGEEDADDYTGLNDYLAGGLEDAVVLLADELYREVSSVGTGGAE